jgi:DNA processing protein
MVPAISAEGVISPYKELMAYEYLYAVEGTSRSNVSSLMQRNGGFPSTAADAIDGILPDSEKRTEVTQHVKDRLGSFSTLVDGTPQFPCGLRAQKNPLPVFYYRGDINLADSRCISVVGTRHPSERGRLAAARIASALARHGFTVVDGLAAGIDAVVAETALGARGRVIGVIGTPIDRYYPKESEDLQELVATEHLLISQVPIYRYDHQPLKAQRFYFPERNITMAASSEATVIVEAGETSGTRTQARACIEQHKKLILLPSAVEQTTWAAKMAEYGAVLAKSVAEVLTTIGCNSAD